MRLRLRHVGLLAALAAVAAFAACTLNPQPLPPSDFNGESTSADASARSDSGAFGTSPEVPGPEDAASGKPNADAEGGAGGADDAGDGGDASDGGDAAADADGG